MCGIVATLVMSLLMLGGERVLTNWGLAKQGGVFTYVMISIAAVCLLLLVFLATMSYRSRSPHVPHKAMLPNDDYHVAYAYSDSEVAMADVMVSDFSSLAVGDELRFITEPKNPHDARAIKIQVRGKDAGYVYRSKNQDMIHDWIQGGLPISAKITKVLPVEKRVFYTINFYKKGSEKMIAALTTGETGKLTRTTSAEAQMNISSTDVGEKLLVYPSEDGHRLDVSSSAGFIGSLPGAMIMRADDGAEFFVSSIDKTPSGKLSVTVAAHK